MCTISEESRTDLSNLLENAPAQPKDIKEYIEVHTIFHEQLKAYNRFLKEKLQSLEPDCREILDLGAFSIRRTSNNYARTAVDMCLEQTVNRNASSPLKEVPLSLAHSDGSPLKTEKSALLRLRETQLDNSLSTESNGLMGAQCHWPSSKTCDETQVDKSMDSDHDDLDEQWTEDESESETDIE
ncbi:hypothetical protein Pcinc_007855 [Petrolisthes cinctipes]|uniref:Uncharacterized protein n=1 Tax=Petrolisthes cinctipes TaxID=88211 RepID=A0AAE1GA59_PETCI|nr:hypothetical protein Pcinc_007855 [Petrolisthes cinctipes]